MISGRQDNDLVRLITFQSWQKNSSRPVGEIPQKDNIELAGDSGWDTADSMKYHLFPLL